MTDIDEPATRRRFTWSPRAQGNRIVYSLVIGWAAWLALQRPSQWLALVVAVLAYTAFTAGLRIIR